MSHRRLSRPKKKYVAQYRVKTGFSLGSFISWMLAILLAAGIVFYGPGLLVLKPNQPKAHASALSFICASSAATTSTAACTGEQAGDLLLVTAFRDNSSTAPSLPGSGFTNINTVTNSGGGTLTSLRSGWGTAANSSSNSGTWTNATHVIMQVYRGQAASPIGNNATSGGNNSGTLVTFAADTLSVTDGSSWFAGFAVRGTADAKMATAPAGMTNRTSTPATPFAGGHDLNGPTSNNWPSTNVTSFGAAAKFTSIVIEVKAAPNITVGATGTQVSSATQGSTANYIGGAFTFIRDVGTANITSIKIHDTGTINANSNLSNLTLFYKQEAVCSTSIPSGTTQFNATGGSFSASEDSTVTGTMAVGTSQICVYAQVDISAGASVGDTIDFQIGNTPTDNPSTDVVVSAGSVLPTSNVAISGTTTVASSAPTTDQLLRGGEYFQSGAKQKFFWAS